MFFKDESEYERYLRKNKVNSDNRDIEKFFEWSEDGEILLEKSKLEESVIDVETYTNCICWAMLKGSDTMVLLKSQFGDMYRDLKPGDYYIAMYNNILLPQIANQFQNKSAKYYIAKNKTSKKNTYERKYILTVDFKENDEELIHGEEILEDTNCDIRELNIEELINATEEYLKKYRYNGQDIERIRIDFIKQSLFNRFIKQYDENNRNWGILVDENKHFARIAPLYDMECSCEIAKKSKHMRRTNDGSILSLENFMNQYKDEEWFKVYIEELIENFNLERAFTKSKEETNAEIPEKYKERYRTFFGTRFQELKQAYEKIFLNKDEKDKEETEK